MELKRGLLKRVRKLGKGQTMAEYSIILLLILVTAFSAYEGLGLEAKAFAGNVVTFISTVVGAL
jgi:hypothetical protein